MNKKHIILIHLFLWIYLLYPEFSPWIFGGVKSDPYYFIMLPINCTLHIINFYIFYLFILPVFFKRKWITLGIITGIVYTIVFTAFRITAYYVYDTALSVDTHEKIVSELTNSWVIAKESRVALVISIYALFTRFTIDWFRNQKQRADLITQTQASELALLRSQINPHFLFNTLNNIYSLVYQKSPDAPQAVMKLSSIMRYMLYEANTDMVPLEKEVEYLQSFIDLQKIRIKDQDFVQLNIEGNIRDHIIAPMLLIPFVENAFKHCDKKANSPGISILLHAKPDRVTFSITNCLQLREKTNKDQVGGIGLQNIKRRLELIYSGHYSMKIDTDNERFSLFLEIMNP